MPALVHPGLINPQEVRELMARPNRSALDDIVQTGQAHPSELYRFIRDGRPLTMANRPGRIALRELDYVADLLGVHPQNLRKALGLTQEVAGGAGLAQSYATLEYASLTTGTQLNTFTTEASLQANLPDITIPAGFFAGNEGVGRSWSVDARGQLGTTGTPTFTFTLRIIPSLTWSAGGVGQSTAAITCGSGVTLAPWHLQAGITCRSSGKGGASNATLIIQGEVLGGTAFAAGGGVYSLPGANVALTVSLDPGATQYIYLSAACGTSNASNLIQMTQLLAMALN